MNMKKKILTLLVLLMTAVSGAWAQEDEVALTPVSDGSWTLVMPSADVELEVEYYTDAELLEMGEAVELTKTADGVWTLAAMPECDIELIVAKELMRCRGPRSDARRQIRLYADHLRTAGHRQKHPPAPPGQRLVL